MRPELWLRGGVTWLAIALVVFGFMLAMARVVRAQTNTNVPTLIFGTGFESAEGYTLTNLWGQMGWVGDGSGGNGVVSNFFDGYGQQAYIGFSPPDAPKFQVLSLWRPLDPAPPGLGEKILRFNVLMDIEDSINGKYDDFRWSVYNSASSRLFTVDFDNSRAEIFYALDDNAGFKSTGFTFLTNTIYELTITMNFARNNWMAALNGQVVVDSQPLTTVNARLDLSDVDAVWAIRNSNAPGDNFMLFDDYQITAEPGDTIPPQLELIGRQPDGKFELLLHGERGLAYIIDASTDMRTWSPLITNTPPTGLLDFVDATAPGYPLSFYRARQAGH